MLPSLIRWKQCKGFSLTWKFHVLFCFCFLPFFSLSLSFTRSSSREKKNQQLARLFYVLRHCAMFHQMFSVFFHILSLSSPLLIQSIASRCSTNKSAHISLENKEFFGEKKNWIKVNSRCAVFMENFFLSHHVTVNVESVAIFRDELMNETQNNKWKKK